jgi:hypothetical protein
VVEWGGGGGGGLEESESVSSIFVFLMNNNLLEKIFSCIKPLTYIPTLIWLKQFGHFQNIIEFVIIVLM